jgi:hypothetical protein
VVCTVQVENDGGLEVVEQASLGQVARSDDQSRLLAVFDRVELGMERPSAVVEQVDVVEGLGCARESFRRSDSLIDSQDCLGLAPTRVESINDSADVF